MTITTETSLRDRSHLRGRSRGWGFLTVLTGAVASIALALSVSPSFAAFTASIVNDTDTAGAGVLTMQEADSTGEILCNSNATSVSSNSATCSTINKYGGNLAMSPGQTVTTAITIKNTGSVAATAFTVTPGTCTQSANGTVNGSATDLCAKMNLTIKSGTTVIYTGTLTGFSSSINILSKLPSTTSITAGTTTPFSFAVQLDSSATTSYAGLKVSQPITWTFTA